MKKISIYFALATLLMTGCNHDKKELTTHKISGEQNYVLTYDEQLGPWGNTVGLKKSYCIEWPGKGFLSVSAERELMYLCFGDSSTTNAEKAAKAWLAKPYIYEEDGVAPNNKTVDSLDESQEFCYVNIKCNVEHDSTLANFAVNMECYALGAHGFYSVDYLTVDLTSGKAIHLTDLVADTNLLREAIARAIQDLEVNKDVRECLYDEFRDTICMPMPQNFIIDSARNSITVVYDLYEIQPYACGIPSVILPIFWLSKHVELTPYAKRIFGPDSYIKE